MAIWQISFCISVFKLCCKCKIRHDCNEGRNSSEKVITYSLKNIHFEWMNSISNWVSRKWTEGAVRPQGCLIRVLHFAPKGGITFDWTWRIWYQEYGEGYVLWIFFDVNVFETNSRKKSNWGNCKKFQFLSIYLEKIFKMLSEKSLAFAYLRKKSTHAWLVSMSILLKVAKIICSSISLSKVPLFIVVMICHLIGQNIVSIRKWCKDEDQQEVTWSFEVSTPD